jgi:hypothetical protein
VATIIHAVSAALMVEASAAAGVENTTIVARPISAASVAARHDAPMVFPQPVMILLIARQASLPDATKALRESAKSLPSA